MTQKDKVLNHLKKYGKITSGVAITRLGITRLAAVVFDLKKEGHDIETFPSKTKGFATYRLNEEERQENE